MAKQFLSGNEAFAYGVRLARPQVISAYPITPQTIVVEKLSEFVEDGSLNAEFIHVESEHSALSCAMGASSVGARAFTATSSQGLLYMAECLPYAAGGRFPIVMMNANRSTALPWNIYGDQRDSLSQLDSGWIQAYACNAQEALDLALMSFYIAEHKDVSTPFMANLDGFVLTHTYEVVDVPTAEQADAFLPKYQTDNKMDLQKPRNLAFSAGPDTNTYFKYREHLGILNASKIIDEAEERFAKIFGRRYTGLTESYRTEDADYILITLGSLSGLVREVVDELRKEGSRVGLLRLRYLRPFPNEEKEIVKFAYENAPYYKRSFDEAGVKPEDIKTLKDIQKFPFINKKTQRDTQGVGSFLGELAAVPEEDVVFISTSSGSTGVPTMSPFTKKDFDEFQDTESRWFWQIGMRPNDRYVHALNFSLYVGGPDVIGAQNLGALCIWGGTLPSERLLFVLKTYQPTVIWTSPSYAWQLGEKALKSGIDPKKDLNIKKIIVAGELGGSIDATRKAIEDIWGAEVYDFYGLSDIFGACAAMCEAKDGLHIAENHILVETIDIHTGEILEPGQVGELVFTTLRKHARPLIRFRTGDIGRIDNTKCSCGRTHGRIHILGRKDDMFIVSAVNVFPSDIEAVIREQDGITGEYLIRIFERDFTNKYAVEIEKNADNPKTDEQVAAEVSAALKARIGVKPARVVVHPDGGLDTRSEHKSKRVIDERNLEYVI